MKKLKIYIAGPDVFEQDSIAIGKRYCELCFQCGYEGLYPLDNIVDFNQPKQKIAQDIYIANNRLIDTCDIVIANLNPFRGKEADSGTIWECGYATGLGKKVYGYMDSALSYVDQFSDDEKRVEEGVVVDLDDKMIEDFEYQINLMIACSVEEIVIGGFEDALNIVLTNSKK